MKDTDLLFDRIRLLYYKFHKRKLKCGGSYIESLYWLKKKRNKKSYKIKRL